MFIYSDQLSICPILVLLAIYAYIAFCIYRRFEKCEHYLIRFIPQSIWKNYKVEFKCIVSALWLVVIFTLCIGYVLLKTSKCVWYVLYKSSKFFIEGMK